jgi:hypothetical protein
MRSWLALAVALVLASAIGCAHGRQAGGTRSKAGESITVRGPEKVELRPGETESFTLNLDRKGFDEDVKITMEGLPNGVKIQEESLTIPTGESKKIYTLEATKDAKPGKAAVTVTARAADTAKTHKFEVHLIKPSATDADAKKKELKVSEPEAVTIKPGGTAKLVVELTRRGFEEDATVKLEDLPEGVRVKKQDATSSTNTQKETIILEATRDAKAGMSEATVKVTAEDQTKTVKVAITVEKIATDDTSAKKKKELQTKVQEAIKKAEADLKTAGTQLKNLKGAAQKKAEQAKKDAEKSLTELKNLEKKIADQAADEWDAFAKKVQAQITQVTDQVAAVLKAVKKK